MIKNITTSLFFALFCLAIVLANLNFVYSQAYTGPIKIVLGEEERVFEYVKDRCAELDLPDVYTHALRTHGGIVLVSGNAPDNYFMFGKDFNSLKRSCEPVFKSGDKWDIESFDHQEWITSVYTEDGLNIHALVHNEYHDPYSSKCKPGVTDPSNPCWYNYISYAKSTDGGRTFIQPDSPNHLVAMLPFRWNPDAVPRGAPPPHGYFEPSNIIKYEGYYYCIMFGIVSNTDMSKRGTCIMRTDDISSPNSWKIWDGRGFNIPLVNPYKNPPEDSSKFLPAFISFRTIRDLRGSLTFNTYLNQFMLVGAGVHIVNGKETCGFFLSRSENLINWSQPQLIKETILGWSPCNFQSDEQAARNIIQEAYPSLIDHDAPDINFTYVDSTAYLYFMQNMDNWRQGGWGFRRDLVRIPITFIKEEISNIGDNNQPDIKLSIHHNPASDYIEIAVPAEGASGDALQVRIYNMLGQCVVNYELPSTNNEARAKIDIKYLPAGLYYIRIGSKGMPFIKN